MSVPSEFKHHERRAVCWSTSSVPNAQPSSVKCFRVSGMPSVQGRDQLKNGRGAEILLGIEQAANLLDGKM